MRGKILFLVIALLAIGFSSAQGETISVYDKLLANDGEAGDFFGRSVSIYGDTAVIGAENDDDTGSAYVFVRDGTSWIQQTKLVANDAGYFPKSVAVSGDIAVIGAPSDYDNGIESGSAYVFVRDGTSWVQQAKLLADDGAVYDRFGSSVVVSRGTAIIGAPGHDDIGAAYVFVRDGTSWVQQAKIVASDGEAEDLFGISVAVDADTAVIAAIGDDDNGDRFGSAYVFVRDGTSWIQQDKLLAEDGGTFDHFGHMVAVSGDTAVIGAIYDDDNGVNSGSAYVFVRDGTSWNQQDKLLAEDGEDADWFGLSGAFISSDAVVIGAAGDDDIGSASGAAYIFVRDGTSWIQRAKLVASDGWAADAFGESVATSGDTALIGAFGSDDNGSESGSAYIVDFDSDGDDVPLWVDNCPTVSNPDQTDSNLDGYGDACVSTDADIDPSSTIGFGSIVGANTTIDKNVTIGAYAIIGNNVVISKKTVAGSHLEIGDGSIISQSVTLRDNVQIGTNVTIGRQVTIGNNVTIGDYTEIGNKVSIGDYVDIGTNVVIEQRASVTSGTSTAPTIVPDYELIPKATTYPPTP